MIDCTRVSIPSRCERLNTAALGCGVIKSSRLIEGIQGDFLISRSQGHTHLIVYQTSRLIDDKQLEKHRQGLAAVAPTDTACGKGPREYLVRLWALVALQRSQVKRQRATTQDPEVTAKNEEQR